MYWNRHSKHLFNEKLVKSYVDKNVEFFKLKKRKIIYDLKLHGKAKTILQYN